MSIATDTHVIYTVQPGDTLYSIASRFSSDIQAIAHSNHLFPPVADPYFIFPGQVLTVPVVGEPHSFTFYIVSQEDKLYDIASRFSTHPNVIAALNQLQDPNLIFVGQALQIPTFIYDVEPTDTLNEIAGRFGVTVDDIVRANWRRPGFSPETLWPGYSIIIPY